MQKVAFIEQVAKEAGITKTEADKVVKASLKVIEQTLKSGEKVTITGFGSFEVRERAAREVNNIRTKEKIKVPATKYPAFSAGSELKAAVSGKQGAKAKATSKAKASAKQK